MYLLFLFFIFQFSADNGKLPLIFIWIVAFTFLLLPVFFRPPKNPQIMEFLHYVFSQSTRPSIAEKEQTLLEVNIEKKNGLVFELVRESFDIGKIQRNTVQKKDSHIQMEDEEMPLLCKDEVAERYVEAVERRVELAVDSIVNLIIFSGAVMLTPFLAGELLSSFKQFFFVWSSSIATTTMTMFKSCSTTLYLFLEFWHLHL